jgi:hypothetical protein
LEPDVKPFCRTWDWRFCYWRPPTRNAVAHGADPIPIHQRVSGTCPAWSRISGHASVPRGSRVTDFHQSRVFTDIEKFLS